MADAIPRRRGGGLRARACAECRRSDADQRDGSRAERHWAALSSLHRRRSGWPRGDRLAMDHDAAYDNDNFRWFAAHAPPSSTWTASWWMPPAAGMGIGGIALPVRPVRAGMPARHRSRSLRIQPGAAENPASKASTTASVSVEVEPGNMSPAAANWCPAATRSCPGGNAMKVLVIGSGGREHALAWKLAQSPRVSKCWSRPAMPAPRPKANAATSRSRPPTSTACCNWRRIEGHRADRGRPRATTGRRRGGCVPRAGPAHLRPTAAAQLEGSKAYAADFRQRHGIPTAFYAVHTDVDAALAYLREKGAPIVVKADGPGAGKGRDRGDDADEAEAAVRATCSAATPSATPARASSSREFLDGEEASFIPMVDGKTALPMATSAGPQTRGRLTAAPTPAAWARIRPRPWSRLRCMRG